MQYFFFPETSLRSVSHLTHINHAVMYTLFVSYCSCWCLQEKISNLYLNLFLNISFVLIYLFCYYHATVIENIVYTRSIMYLAFAIFSIEMYNYHFDQIFVIFLGWCVKLVVSSFSNCCIVLHIFRWKEYWLCLLVLLDCKISIVFNCMLGRLYLLTFFFTWYHFDFY